MSKVFLALLVCAVSCTAESPSAEDPGTFGSPTTSGADVIVAFTENGVERNCTSNLPPCGQPVPACGPTQVLGAPDGGTFAIPPGGVLEVAFRCGVILERGGNTGSLDFRVFGDVGAGVAVEVSESGREYANLRPLIGQNPAADLADAGLTTARFVRITAPANAGALIDAVDVVR